jgi:hypothetical protein
MIIIVVIDRFGRDLVVSKLESKLKILNTHLHANKQLLTFIAVPEKSSFERSI